MINFNPGDKVTHKGDRDSRGMVVTNTETDLEERKLVWCEWLDKNGIAVKQSFSPDSLEKISDESTTPLGEPPGPSISKRKKRFFGNR